MARNFFYDDVFALDFCLMNKKDALDTLKMRNHEKVAPFMYARHISQKAHFDFIKKLRKDPTSIYWLFKYSGFLLGVGSLTRINITHKHSYIGIYKNPELPPDTIRAGKIILQNLEKIAYYELGLHSLHLEVLASNVNATAFYERNGYIKEGVLKEFFRQDDCFIDTLVYGKILDFGAEDE